MALPSNRPEPAPKNALRCQICSEPSIYLSLNPNGKMACRNCYPKGFFWQDEEPGETETAE